MKIELKSARVERLEAIVEMASAIVPERDNKTYSFGIEFAVAELVRDEMRELAQHEQHFPDSSMLLDLAIEHVIERVNRALSARQIGIDLGKYLAAVREKLLFPAKEIQKLGKQLTDSRHTAKLGAKERLVSDFGGPLVVHELGLREAIQGLLVEASGDRAALDLDKLKEQPNWRIRGDWFPYELFADDFVFVIDDDGSIFVSTANLPLDIKERANQLLRQVAELLYS